MKGRAVRRLGVAAVLIVCVAAIVGSAAADPTQELSIANVTVDEDAGTATFVVSLTDGPDDDAEVDWATSNGTAVAGQDYTSSSGTVTVPKAGTANVTVPISNDTLDENNENFTVTLSDPERAVISDATATGTIVDDDDAPTVGIADATAVEGASANFAVNLSAASGKTITVNYSTVNGTAGAGRLHGAAQPDPHHQSRGSRAERSRSPRPRTRFPSPPRASPST